MNANIFCGVEFGFWNKKFFKVYFLLQTVLFFFKKKAKTSQILSSNKNSGQRNDFKENY